MTVPEGSPRPAGRWLALLAVAALVLAVGAVVAGLVVGPPAPAPAPGAPRSGDDVPMVADLGPTSFTVPGPFAAGETTMTLADGAPVEVWYPAPRASALGQVEATYNLATWLPPALARLLPAGFSVTRATGAYRGLPAAPGRFPLVVFAHGFSGYRDQSTFLTSWLATWGFVVAAPDLLDHDLTAVLSGQDTTSLTADLGELEATITLVEEAGGGAGLLAGHVDDTKVAAVGHSLGGEASEELASVDPRVSTFIGLAGASVGGFAGALSGPAGRVPDKPGMLMVGTADHVASPKGIARAFGDMVPPKRLVLLRHAGHLAFADVCELAKGHGGLLSVAAEVHISVPAELVPLASDGCQASDLPIATGWAVIRQAVTAQLRHALGFDHSSAGLTGLTRAFPRAVAANVSVSAG